MLACDEDHPSGRNSLILLPDADCVGGGLARACTVPGLPAGRVCCTRFLQSYFKYVSCELDKLSGRYWFPTVERPRFNVASCVINDSVAANTWEYSHTGERGGERGPGAYGWSAKYDDTAAARSRYEVGDYCCGCCSCRIPAILPAGTRMYLPYHTIIMNFSSSLH